jgi:4-hydroxy-2-oxoheptanedioate aldolase
LAPFDLSTALGVSGQIEHPKMQAASARIEAAVHAAGIPLGGAAFSQPATEALIARGYRMVGGFDILWLKSAISASISWISA